MPISKRYDFRKTEKKWQKQWQKEGVYEPPLSKPKRPFYNLMMFPYPSAEGLHVGNMYAFTGADIYGRMKRMQGHDVFEPIGLDGFGIHSENYALKVGTHPAKQAKISEKRFYKQLESIGNGFAWNEHLETYDPEYYRWTQWLFTEMFRRGLAYRKKQAVNWCPSCKTVLADEQVVAGKCERCGTVVIKKELEQWFFRITDYADRLLGNLDTLDWSERVKIAQKNWIGRSEGAEIDFEIKTKEKPNFVLLHGYRGSPQKNFFPWLAEELRRRGYKVQAPALPNPGDPRIKDQADHVLKHVTFDKNTVLLGHSLGSVVALKTLERLRRPVRKTVLVGGFTENRFVDNDNFEAYTFDWKFDEKKIRANAGSLVSLRDVTDDAVPRDQPARLAERFGGSVVDFSAEKPHARGSKEPFVLRNALDALTVFTTRPDTLFGATYMVVAPEHELIAKSKGHITNWREVEAYVSAAKKRSDEERIAEGKEKTGVELKGIKAVNPANEEEIPVFVADYVLSGYGTGAIMAVPAHDERDFAFAKKHELPIRMVICPHYPAKTCPVMDGAYTGSGHLVDSGRFDGLPAEEAAWKIVAFVRGERKTQFRLRDWLISRQRYWGPPIPMVFCAACAKQGKGERAEMAGWYAVPAKDLPVKLPVVKDFRPTGKDESPLAAVKSFYETKCPGCKGKARRETDVSDTFLDSAWYYLRYLNPKDKKTPLDKLRVKKWLPVAMYTGGAEHAVLHLLYVRFMAMALHDWGMVHFDEPMKKFRAHGLLVKDGAKMSKSKGNVVNPDEYISKFGADVLRTYLMFLAPFEQGGDFRDAGVLGVERFLQRVWRLARDPHSVSDGWRTRQLMLHRTIKKVTEDIENLQYNTAVSQLMICLKALESYPDRESFADFLKLLAPFAPHMAEEIWRNVLGNKTSIHRSPWPKYDPKLLVSETFTLVIQVNGKTRATVEASADISENEAKELALGVPKIQELLAGKAPKRVIYVPKRIVSIVL